MDTVFFLAPDSRRRLLEHAAARVPCCRCVFLWGPIGHSSSSNHLFCLDAWLAVGGGGGGDRVRLMFDAYKASLCAIVRGFCMRSCVPGWAYKDGRAYMEMPESDLMASASLPVQQQFYQEAGIKAAVFMGCEGGEIEVGLSTAAVASMTSLQANVQQVFSESFVQQWLLEELLQAPPPAGPSSSSSSLRSLSVGSPEYSSLVRSMAASGPPVTEPSLQEPQPPPPPTSPPERLLLHAYGQHDHVPFPSPGIDDAAMAQAMIAIISSSAPPSPSALPPRPPPPMWLARRHAERSPRRATAFKSYSAVLAPRTGLRPGTAEQRMVKTGISMLSWMHEATHRQERAAARQAVSPLVTGSQLHHMISERRRRVRLNESFQALRGMLPPGTKKDKATILARTTQYMNELIAQLCDLEQKNRLLETEARNYSGERRDVISGSSERVQVEVTGGASTATASEPREVTVRVAVRAWSDMPDLVMCILRRLKEVVGGLVVVSVDARQEGNVRHAQANLSFGVTAGEYDETSLKEAVTKVVEDAVAPPPPPDES